MNIDIETSIEDDRWAQVADLDGVLRRAFETAASMAQPARRGELSVLLSGDARLRALNKIFRDKDEPTNVLSFPPAAGASRAATPPIGDIAISFDSVAREASRDNKTVQDHLTHLAVHGLLHLFGYDHEDEADADSMERLETAILSRLGIADPYATGAREPDPIDAN